MSFSKDDAWSGDALNAASGQHGTACTPTESDTGALAITGIGCRLPGNISSPSELWAFLKEGRSGRSQISESRFIAENFFHPDSQYPGALHSTEGYFLTEDIRRFDNTFFGINNLETTYMDPQQRKLLEIVYECFEDAGVTIDEVSGSDTGCFVGNFTNDFQLMSSKDPESFHRYSATGMGVTLLANRISYTFNLKGPSLVVDTACSSSLYAVHLACNALKAGECSAAIVVASNLIQSPEVQIATTKAGVLSATGTCHTFDSSADGYGRAEGVSAIYIKPLQNAVLDGERIRSVIRGTAVNSNGKTPGITMPSAFGQESVIRQAYANARLGLGETDYVECHGTGTPVGDPIEVEALSGALKRTDGRRILIGSIKSNLGHSEAASGLSSIIKVTLALENDEIPPTVGLKTLNPKIKEDSNVEVVTQAVKWPTDSPRASINSFGYGGANAHCIIESAKHFHSIPHDVGENSRSSAWEPKRIFILPFTASSKRSLTLYVSKFSTEMYRSTDIHDLAYTLGHKISNFPIRGFLLARAHSFLLDIRRENLRQLSESNSPAALPLVYVFTGQGAQWPGMARELVHFPVFKASIDYLDTILTEIDDNLPWKINGLLRGISDQTFFQRASCCQPLCTAIQIALVDQLFDWGIRAAAVVGHSSGEIAASYAAGHVTSAHALRIAYFRGLVLETDLPAGSMLAVGLGPSEAQTEIERLDLTSSIRVACINSPDSVTLSGDESSISKVLSLFNGRKIFARKLNTDGKAYHSQHMIQIGPKYEALLEKGIPKESSTKRATCFEGVIMVSSVTGFPISSEETARHCYWRRNLESPVVFSEAISRLNSTHDYHFVEIGPHSTLELPIKSTCSQDVGGCRWFYSALMKRGKPCDVTVLEAVGNLFLRGHDIAFGKVNGLDAGKVHIVHDLPRYAWDHSSLLWHEPRISSEYRQRSIPWHELLGSPVVGLNKNIKIWRNILNDKPTWLLDHKIGERVIFPAAAYVALAVEASKSSIVGLTSVIIELHQVRFLKTLELSEPKNDTELFTTLQHRRISGSVMSQHSFDFEISSLIGATSSTHARGRVSIRQGKLDPPSRKSSAEHILSTHSPKTWYQRFAEVGFNVGPKFKSLVKILTPEKMDEFEASGESKVFTTDMSQSFASDKYVLHPVTVDAAFQTGAIATTAGTVNNLHCKVPVAIDYAAFDIDACAQVNFWTTRGWSEVTGIESRTLQCELYNDACRLSFHTSGLRIKGFNVTDSEKKDQKRHPMLRASWKPDFTKLRPSQCRVTEEPALKVSMNVEGNENSSALDQIYTSSIELFVHKYPEMSILYCYAESCNLTDTVLRALDHGTPFLKYHTFEEKRVNMQANNWFTDGKICGPYDLIAYSSSEPSSTFEDLLSHLETKLSPSGVLLLSLPLSQHVTQAWLTERSIRYESDRHHTYLMLPTLPSVEYGISSQQNFVLVCVLVTKDELSLLGEILIYRLRSYHDILCKQVSLGDVDTDSVPAGCIVLSTIEWDLNFLSEPSADEYNKLKILTGNARCIVWLLQGKFEQNPQNSIMTGLARALVLEQPSLTILSYCIDVQIDHDFYRTASNILLTLHHCTSGIDRDVEFLEENGEVYVSRFVADHDLNQHFRRRQVRSFSHQSLSQLGTCKLSMEAPGQFDSLYFSRIEQDLLDLPDDHVEVQVSCVSLNAKDLLALSDKVDVPNATSANEMGGTILRTGAQVKDFVSGDRVLAVARRHFDTIIQIPSTSCVRLESNESVQELCTIPISFCSALHALRDRANIKHSDTVLVHTATSSFGQAAIQIAQMFKAKVIATVSNNDKKAFLTQTYGICEENILNSKSSTLYEDIMSATRKRGVDIVLNTLTGEQLHQSWQACAPYGRFVELGRFDISDYGKLDLNVFKLNTTFTSFDLGDMFYSSDPERIAEKRRLLDLALAFYRTGQIRLVSPIHIIDISQLADGFRMMASRTRIGKVVVSMSDASSKVRYLLPTYSTRLDASKSYLMIGCFGGLGRSLSKWMIRQGARKFVFMSRSGSSQPQASRLKTELESFGATVIVVRGDVAVIADVERAVSAVCDLSRLGGVIHAAMGLSVGFAETAFLLDGQSMTLDSWMTSIRPKVHGTWNLHNALGRDSRATTLDFFLMTSSISGSVGTATEANYCAANSFQDSFARYRRRLGLPAVALALGMVSEVGYLAEHPEIEALLLRKGLQPIKEQELLNLIDIALSTNRNSSNLRGSNGFHEAHILTGMEASGFRDQRLKGFEGTSHVMEDPRFALLTRALVGMKNENLLQLNSKEDSWPPEVVSALASKTSLFTVILNIVAHKISNLILVPLEQLEPMKRLATYGMDSMLAAELRTYLFHTLKADVPFLMLLAEDTTPNGIVVTICDQLNKKNDAAKCTTMQIQ